MNTQDDWRTTARVTNPERKVFWQSIFGGDTVPIVSFIPKMANLPGFDNPQHIYELDLKAITDDQRVRLVNAIARKFDMTVEAVDAGLDDHGVPILLSDVIVSSTDRALFMGAVL